jgi:hypothetical protein
MFNFPVTQAESIKTSSEFREWENTMQKRAGIDIQTASMASLSSSVSCCPCADDCDVQPY